MVIISIFPILIIVCNILWVEQGTILSAKVGRELYLYKEGDMPANVEALEYSQNIDFSTSWDHFGIKITFGMLYQ